MARPSLAKFIDIHNPSMSEQLWVDQRKPGHCHRVNQGKGNSLGAYKITADSWLKRRVAVNGTFFYSQGDCISPIPSAWPDRALFFYSQRSQIMPENPKVLLETSAGNITLELDAEKAPITVENFLQYVEDGFYDGTVFHRVIDNFMIQGGGMTADLKQKNTKSQIQNEADNGLKNVVGSIAMARTSDVHSATAQFFININDNNFLDHQDKSAQGYGYTVFGQVTDGMDVVNSIRKVKTGSKGMHQDVPVEPVTITKATKL
jgi:peptidyl-prolyl cis-trans isomerase B (cyclophilin B)